MNMNKWDFGYSHVRRFHASHMGSCDFSIHNESVSDSSRSMATVETDVDSPT
ncbi:hypothetical protein M378DRAFT_171123 [Amanita muscaria Koide BX008]|uniref:Uncharacterized protein n=1 Tax=Amanita muscaria (strain Koide BX008) TaxID=946122 RepID=A0A0C2S5K7_AMAMK|nr:hypothetical protein M378DRAFT_171123 [Amanita muscaria Koide BX008]